MAAARSAAHARFANTLIDRQLEEAKLVDQVVARGEPLANRLRNAVRALVQRAANGRIDKATAKAAFDRAFIALALLELAQSVDDVRGLVDEYLAKEWAAINALGEPVANVAFITSDEVRARAQEKAGALAPDGTLKTEGA